MSSPKRTCCACRRCGPRGFAGAQAFLALEWIETGAASVRSERRLEEGLAALHAVRAERFGWRIDNSIAPTPQFNGWQAQWPVFWRERRLRPQLKLAVRRGFGRLLEASAALLAGHRPQPALLHGDPWAGNWCADADGVAAVYHGDREADVAMTRLCGGFGRDFDAAYEDAAPLPAGHAVRAEPYDLYHVLNHVILFGGGYAPQTRSMMERLAAEARS